MSKFTIEAYSLPLIGGTASHNFWVLRDSDGNVAAELHGLATNRETGQPEAIGSSEKAYSLSIWHIVHDQAYLGKGSNPTETTSKEFGSYINPDAPNEVMFIGSKEEALARWNSAVDAMPMINSFDLDYPGLGVSIVKDTVNSNSTYRTLGEIMGLAIVSFKGLEPGIDNRMISEAAIEYFRNKNYPILTETNFEEGDGDPDWDEEAQAYRDGLIDKYVSGNLVDLNPWRSILNGLMRFATFDNAPAPRDPIILDLNGDGISTIASGGNTGQKFDFNDDGLKTAAGWVAPTDGVLGIDQNGDGKLTSGKELIGDQTELKDGRIAAHGYEVIADLDSNGDGIINALDPDFHKLKVWVDKNSDGISQADELFTLTDLGIIGLNLEHKMTSETLNGNNVLSHIGSYIKADGTNGLMGNVNFMPDDLYTEYVDKIALTPEQAAMSNIGGLGRVRPLAEALTLSSDLKLKFDVYRAAVTKAAQLEALEDLLLAWAATESKFQRVSFEDAKYFAGSNNAVGSGGGTTGGITLEIDPLKERWVAAEIKVSILNSFFNLEDRAFYKLPSHYENKTWTNLAFNTSTLDTIDRIYHQLTSNMYRELLVETRLSPYLHQITVTEAGLDFTKVIALFDQVAITDTRKAFVDLAEFITLFEDKNSVLSLISTLDRYAKLGVMSDSINDWMKELSLEVDVVKKLGLIIGNSNGSVLNGTSANDLILGIIDEKEIIGESGNDIINSGTGANHLIGGLGSDTYIFSKGHGQDVISDIGYSSERDTDTLHFTDIKSTEVKFARNGNNLILFGYNGNDQITIEHFFYGSPYAIEVFKFSDKTISYDELMKNGLVFSSSEATVNGWEGVNIIQGNENNTLITATNSADNIVYAGAGDKTITTGTGNDTIYAGTGNNHLIGGHGSDTYVFSKGHGQDVIGDIGYLSERDTDTIHFTDVTSTEVKFARSGNNLILFGYNGKDQITIEHFFYGSPYAIEVFKFVDKTISHDELMKNGLIFSSSEATVNGWEGVNIIQGNENNISITATNSANNIVYAGAGDKTITTGTGNDTIYAGTGNNHLIGGHGSDTYVFSKGHGQDVIGDIGYLSERDTDTIHFTDVTSTEVKFARNGNNLILFGYNGNNQITIEHFFYGSPYAIEVFEFADKTISYDELLKTSIPDFTAEDQASLVAAQAELDAAQTLSQVMSPASYLMMDELFANTASTVGMASVNAMASNEIQADIAKEVQSLINAMASFGVTEGSIQIDDQTYGYLTPITVPS